MVSNQHIVFYPIREEDFLVFPRTADCVFQPIAFLELQSGVSSLPGSNDHLPSRFLSLSTITRSNLFMILKILLYHQGHASPPIFLLALLDLHVKCYRTCHFSIARYKAIIFFESTSCHRNSLFVILCTCSPIPLYKGKSSGGCPICKLATTNCCC